MMTMAMKRSSVLQTVVGGIQRAYASLAVGSDIVSAAPNVSLQKARSWDEGVSSKFATTPLRDIFKGKKVVIFGLPAIANCALSLLWRHGIIQLNNMGYDYMMECCVSGLLVRLK